MDSALSILADGRCVAVEAVPGAGKTRLILEACKHKVPSLILAYNKELAERVSSLIDPSHVVCVTFHSLCSRCLAPVRDDTQLLKVVIQAEEGELVPTNVPNVCRILIDEAQDVRALYVRLVRVLGLVRDGVSIMVAGDRNQLVYDFDDDFPATLDTLTKPHTMFGGPLWERITLHKSSRLTKQMALFINSVFGTYIDSTKEGPLIDVRSPRNLYSGLYDTLVDVFEEGQVLLLVDRKNGNRPLRNLLNTASRGGHVVNIHGLDETCCNDGIQCGTFWSAKGLESQTVVVLLPGAAPRNPTYVALTRSCHRLIVVLDPREPHPIVCKTIHQHPSWFTLRDAWTQCVVNTGSTRDDAHAFQGRIMYSSNESGRLRCLDRFLPRQSIVDPSVQCAILKQGETTSTPMSTLSHVYIMMGLLKAEFLHNRMMRAMMDILHPTRIEFEQVPDAIRAGLMSRTVPRFVTDDALLADDLRQMAIRAYERMSTKDDLAQVALAVLSWDSWDHTMRSLHPVSSWSHKGASAIEFITKTIPSSATFDVRLRNESSHVRVHATTPQHCFHFVWEATSTDITAAAVRAAMHPQKRCIMAEVGSETLTQITADVAILNI